MALRIYDTRQKRLVDFEPRQAGRVGIYTCGPTVYRDAHIGNFRTFLFEDLLRRTLKFLGFEVTQVMNLTDVDDRTINEARAKSLRLDQVTAPVTERFFEDLHTLNVEPAEHYPRATDHVPEMVALIQSLLDKGFAYQMDGSVYFSIAKFARYGGLSGMKLEHLARGVRIDADDYAKDDFRDFALWKGWTEGDGDVVWEAPFGRGRPGWHIECSAMSMKYLGEEFDLHTGGVDNIFPHHENEIAQSVAGTGKEFARYWMHSAHLVLEGEKMSKSLGNIITLRELMERGYSARAIRYVLLSAHYRQPLNFSHDAIEAAGSSLARLDTLRQLLFSESGDDGSVRPELVETLGAAENKFQVELEDDLNISGALAAVFDLVSAVHRLNNNSPLNASEIRAVEQVWQRFDTVLGFLFPPTAALAEDVQQMVRQRAMLRRGKQFGEADDIRNRLSAEGYIIEDAQGGSWVIWIDGREFVGNGQSV